VQDQLEHLDGLAKTTPLWPGAPLAREIRARLEEWHEMLGRQPTMARQVLRKVLVGRITMRPVARGKQRYYEWSGTGLASILDAMRSRERRLAEVKTLLEHLDDLAALSRPRTGDALTREIRARLTNWAVLVGQQPAVARQILRKLLVGRLRLTPKITEGGRWYEFSGRASYGALLKGSIVVMVPPG